MAARAMWKGVVRFADERVPVKLYSAVQDRAVHFRLLHRKDEVPVKQFLVSTESGDVVPYENTRRGFVTDEGELVMLQSSELEALEPEPSRDIEVLSVLPLAAIGPRWYDRPYYLGPDGDPKTWSAMITALEQSGRVCLLRWVMRKKEYLGALGVRNGYPLVMTLRHAEEVVAVDELEPPPGRELSDKELAMAQQLMAMLEEDFVPTDYHDEYRERVLELVHAKAEGGTVTFERPERARPAEDLSKALEASLKQERKVG